MFSLALPLPMFRRARRRRGNVSALQRVANVDARPWNIVMLGALVAMTIGYLALTNGNATAGYELRTLEDRAVALRDETRQLELQTIASQSETRIIERIADMGYVPVASVRYLTAESAVALRR